jgi:hypothetical protein
MLVSRINIPQKWRKNKATTKLVKEVSRINIMEDQSICQMYQNRVRYLLTQTPMSLNINKVWQLLKSILSRAAMEALGKREKRCYKRGRHILNDELSAIIKTKKEAISNILIPALRKTLLITKSYRQLPKEK